MTSFSSVRATILANSLLASAFWLLRRLAGKRGRGKLTEFNALLRGESNECFSQIVGDTSILPAIKFVITLDTQLSRDADELAGGTIARLLNRPQFDPVKGVV